MIFELLRVEGRSAVLKRGNEEMKIEVGTVVFGVGAVPDAGPDSKLLASIPKVIKVGDCVKPRRILDAIQEGFDAGRNI